MTVLQLVCSDFGARDCCDSCHEDMAQGVDSYIEFHIPENARGVVPKRVQVFLCCGYPNSYSRSEIARAARKANKTFKGGKCVQKA